MGHRRNNHLNDIGANLAHAVWGTCRGKSRIELSNAPTVQLKARRPNEVFGQLVALGFDVTVFTPAPYRRRRLRRPSKELSSRGGLRA